VWWVHKWGIRWRALARQLWRLCAGFATVCVRVCVTCVRSGIGLAECVREAQRAVTITYDLMVWVCACKRSMWIGVLMLFTCVICVLRATGRRR
jgi:hypothetical protein